MDITGLINPTVNDREALQEFIEALADQIPGIERCIADLRKTPTEHNLIAALFRGLHTIKGDAGMCHVNLGVMIAHPIESVLARLRAGELRFTELLAEAVLLALDRLELAVEALSDGRPLDSLKLPELVGGFELLGKTPADQIDAQAARVIEAVTGFRPPAAARLGLASLGIHGSMPLNQAGDLKFFHQLAVQFEARSELFKGRTTRLLRLALDTNLSAGNPVDPVQLEAAIYLHDVGMMFLPETVWLKVGRLSADDLEQMHSHPGYAAGLLERMPGWEEATQIVAQHHEMPDGRGYPQKLSGSTICAGARILAIVDAFEAVTLKQSHRGQSRSLLRAVAEINACDTQFDPEWIGRFNQVIRQTLEV
jgi:HPt (histidine-containing phosphotransfer) domain-containing protein